MDTEPRLPGCQCQWEAGDSPCPVHGEEENTCAVWVVHSPAGWPVDVRLSREEAEFAVSHEGETVREYRPVPAKQEATCACRAYGTDGLHYATCELRRSSEARK